MIETENKLLVFGRGEGAGGVIHTAQKLGIATATVFTPYDKGSLHVRYANEAHPIESYQDIPGAIKIAEEIGAKMIHPVWGFQSENPGFPKACKEAGIKFVGPGEHAMREAGDKEVAKKIAGKLYIPVVESSSGSSQNIRDFAIDLGLSDDLLNSVPVMIKAARAGGGNGNRLVTRLSDLDAVLERLEQNFNGNGNREKISLFAERFILGAQHVEVQLLGDEHGGLVHFGTRNCSIQLRQQKVIEEAPAPFLSEEKERELYKYALKFGEHIGYTNAGTVEFLVDRVGNIFFLEFNPRLQVEHRVTELITGSNLVKHQIEIAEGGHVPTQDEIKFSGSAIEARINAQRFNQGTLLPAGGVVERVIFPKGEDIIVDHNLYNGYEINLNYDPTQAKVAVKGENREDAIGTLQKALKAFLLEGVSTNIEFVLGVLSSKEFAGGQHTTTFFEDMLREMAVAPALQKRERKGVVVLHRNPSPWRADGLSRQMESRSPSKKGWR